MFHSQARVLPSVTHHRATHDITWITTQDQCRSALAWPKVGPLSGTPLQHWMLCTWVCDASQPSATLSWPISLIYLLRQSVPPQWPQAWLPAPATLKDCSELVQALQRSEMSNFTHVVKAERNIIYVILRWFMRSRMEYGVAKTGVKQNSLSVAYLWPKKSN